MHQLFQKLEGGEQVQAGARRAGLTLSQGSVGRREAAYLCVAGSVAVPDGSKDSFEAAKSILK